MPALLVQAQGIRRSIESRNGHTSIEPMTTVSLTQFPIDKDGAWTADDIKLINAIASMSEPEDRRKFAQLAETDQHLRCIVLFASDESEVVNRLPFFKFDRSLLGQAQSMCLAIEARNAATSIVAELNRDQ